jgi:hypothetical protein
MAAPRRTSNPPRSAGSSEGPDAGGLESERACGRRKAAGRAWRRRRPPRPFLERLGLWPGESRPGSSGVWAVRVPREPRLAPARPGEPRPALTTAMRRSWRCGSAFRHAQPRGSGENPVQEGVGAHAGSFLFGNLNPNVGIDLEQATQVREEERRGQVHADCTCVDGLLE